MEERYLAQPFTCEADALATGESLLFVPEVDLPDIAQSPDEGDIFASASPPPPAFGPDTTQVIAYAFRDL